MKLRRRLLQYLSQRLDHPLPLRLVFWDGAVFDFSERPTVILTLATPRVARLMLSGNVDALCEAYVSGEILVDGFIGDIISSGIKITNSIGRLPSKLRFLKALSFLSKLRTKQRDADFVRFHYDVSNEFYRLWLDSNLIYSCAYFRHGDETIDRAQEQKIEHIARKLNLQSSDRFLDIGCGWGALVLTSAARHGALARGATNSPAQFGYASARAGSTIRGSAQFALEDYREIDESISFDKIASVGMYEHVGLGNLQAYFDKVARLLRPGGLFLNHGIFLPNTDGKARGPRADFIGRYVFPGGELPTLPALFKHAIQAGFEVLDFEDLRPHYVRTLSLWLNRLEARKDEAASLCGPERYRVWRMYLAGMAYAFDAGWLSVGQLLLCKPSPQPCRPWTRDYQYSKRRPELAGRLSWNEAENLEHDHVGV